MNNIIHCQGLVEVIFSNLEYGFDKIIKDFNRSEYISIATFNISDKNFHLLNELKKIKNAKKIIFITNIPGRWDQYTGIDEEAIERNTKKAKKKINNYLKKLDHESFNSPIEVYFNFKNHSKIYITSNYAYIGSQNYSDESSKNWEAGVLINDKKKINEINEKFIGELKKYSIRYYGNEIEDFKKQFIENFYKIEKFLDRLRKKIEHNSEPVDSIKSIECCLMGLEKEFSNILLKLNNSDIKHELYSVFKRGIENSLKSLKSFEIKIKEYLYFDKDQYRDNLFSNSLNDEGVEFEEYLLKVAQCETTEKVCELYSLYLESLKELMSNFFPIEVKILKLTSNEDSIDNTN